MGRLCFYICLSFCSQGGACIHGGGNVWHVCMGVCVADEGVCIAEETATAAGGTHPIGMHSCFK